MKNREIYQLDPTTRKLLNEGVANVNDDTSTEAMSVLRFELETFVCDGQYEKGLAHVLETYLANINQPQQPAVWVSGFYGSGKSHLVKMLRALWVDTPFEDGATARGIARLPEPVSDLLKELSTQGKRHGGLFAASGTLGSSSRDRSVRLALLAVIFKAAGLPESYPRARLVMWLEQEGILEEVRSHLEANGYHWEEELENLYVAEGLHQALLAKKPGLFATADAVVTTLNNQYPNVRDISNEEMLKAIRQAMTRDGKLPLILVVLDEVQQYIGEDSRRSNDVQEVVEACCKNVGGKILFAGTGQTAVTGTAHLKKLEGRFTIRVELSDADVDAVIRQVILAKKPEAREAIEKRMQTNLGEISRHLSATSIGHRPEDFKHFVQDYPVLPVRRRFWEATLRVLDQTGTESQLRNQLSMIHKAIQTNVDEPLGHVVPADFLYFDSAVRLLQARILPRKVYEKTMTWARGSQDERLMARAAALVFLINKVVEKNSEVGIRVTPETLADLLVEDLAGRSADLRSRLPQLLDDCELLMKVDDQYRIQTEESAAWNDEFLSHRSALANESGRIPLERSERIRSLFAETAGKLALTQGDSRVSRNVRFGFDSRLPTDAGNEVFVWVRDEWSVEESTVRAEARQAGSLSPVIFVFVPRHASDELRHHLMDHLAAVATLDARGVPSGPEGVEARAAMETVRQTAERRIRELLGVALGKARVFQGGGTEIAGNNLQEMVTEAAQNALKRLYPHFAVADHSGWAKAYERAQKGAPDALKAVSHQGEIGNNPVCKAVLAAIAGGKRGSDIRTRFEMPPYGWPRDAVDGGLQVLLVSGSIRAVDEQGQPISPTDLERKAIGKTHFKVESATVSAAQRLQIRKLYQRAGLTSSKPEEDVAVAPRFVDRLLGFAESAGGEPPKPSSPDTAVAEEIRLTAGNEQLLVIYNHRDLLGQRIDQWTESARRIGQRWPQWLALRRLAAHAACLQDAEVLLVQVKTVEAQRQLLEEPDQIAPLVSGLTQMLRGELNTAKAQWDRQWELGESRLASDPNWNEVEPEQRHALRVPHSLTIGEAPKIEVQDTDAVLRTLEALPLPALRDRIAAMGSRYDQILVQAAKLLEPAAQKIDLPGGTLKTEEDVERWIKEATTILKAALKKGPIVL